MSPSSWNVREKKDSGFLGSGKGKKKLNCGRAGERRRRRKGKIVSSEIDQPMNAVYALWRIVVRTRVSGVAVAYCEQVRGLVARSSHIRDQINVHFLFVKKSPIFSQLSDFYFDSNTDSIRQETRTTMWTEIVQRPRDPSSSQGRGWETEERRRRRRRRREDNRNCQSASLEEGRNDENSDSWLSRLGGEEEEGGSEIEGKRRCCCRRDVEERKCLEHK